MKGEVRGGYNQGSLYLKRSNPSEPEQYTVLYLDSLQNHLVFSIVSELETLRYYDSCKREELTFAESLIYARP